MADIGKHAARDPAVEMAVTKDASPENAGPEEGGGAPAAGDRPDPAVRPPSDQAAEPLTDARPAPRPNSAAICAPMGAPVRQLADLDAPPAERRACRGIEEEVKYQQVAGLLATGMSPMIANLLVAIGVSALLWDGAVANLAIAVWLAVLVLILGVRCLAFRRRPAPTAVESARWLRRFAVSSAITGVWWGMLTVALFTGLAPNEFVLLAMVAAGMSAGAVASYAVYPPAAYGFFAPLLGILAAYFFAQGTFADAVMGGVALVYGGVLSKVVRGVYGWRRELVEMDLQSRQMADELLIIADQSYAMENWFDAEGKLRWASPSALRITGYAPDELLTMNDFPVSLVHSEDKARIAAGMKAAGSTTPLREIEFRLIRKDGAVRWCSVVSRAAFDDENKLIGFRSSVRDVTENHELQEKLREANTNLSTIAEYSHGWEVWMSPAGETCAGSARPWRPSPAIPPTNAAQWQTTPFP